MNPTWLYSLAAGMNAILLAIGFYFGFGESTILAVVWFAVGGFWMLAAMSDYTGVTW